MRFLKSSRSAAVVILGLAVSWGAFAQAKKPPARPETASHPAQAQAQSKAGVQPSKPAEPPPATGATGAAGSTATDAGGADLGNIDEILQGEEDVLSGSGFSYDPGNRRDPFKSLLAAPDHTELRGPRPEGVPGLLIDEIDLTGIFHTSKGFVAQVVASNQKKSYLLKEGDQLYDGDVVSINKNEVVFKQVVQDPTALKPFREVVKSLNPT
jgi:hypothetical protein